MSVDQSRIRNFCIIAHIDHGKSTLADRIIEKPDCLPAVRCRIRCWIIWTWNVSEALPLKPRPCALSIRRKDGEEYIFNLDRYSGTCGF